MKNRTANLTLLLCLLSCTLISGQEKTIKDSLGESYSLVSEPKRIVSLAPNITEILFSLGLEEKIVGVTRYCDYPPEASTKERIGGLVDPNLEKIKSLNPDLVVGFRGNPKRLLERLKSLHIPVFALDIESNLESVFTLIEKIAKITHRQKQARSLILSMKEKYASIQSILQRTNRRPKIFLSLHGQELWTCGRESFLHDLLTKAKSENIAGRVNRKWLNFNREQLIHQDPEIIIILAKSDQEFAAARQWLREHSLLRSVKAVKENRVYFLDENLATRPGPRIVDAIFQIARIIHPALFTDCP